MNLISHSEPFGGAIQSGTQPVEATPLTYGVLRQILVYSGSMDERDAQKMDRAIHRVLDT
jgi:hypothetical protein